MQTKPLITNQQATREQAENGASPHTEAAQETHAGEHREHAAPSFAGGFAGSRRLYQRNYGREWMRRRRSEYFAGKCCAQCGSVDRLELDHIDPASKVHHCVWSWSEERREAELAKCQPLCHACHKAKTAAYNSHRMTGKPAYNRKLSAEQVAAVRKLSEQGLPQREIGSIFGVSHASVHRIMAGRFYRELPNA